MSAVDVHYEATGPADAPVLLLAGSLGSTLDMWNPQVEALAPPFRVVRYDHRGHGGSPVPPGPYTIADLGEDAIKLMDRLSVDRVAFCGLSIGGMVGIWLAANAPDRIESLVLCCTTAKFDDPAPWRERAAAARSGGTGSLAEAVVSRWFTPSWAKQHPDMVVASKAMIAGTDNEGYASCCDALATWDGREFLPRITAPTLVIGGAQDEATPPRHQEHIAATVPSARLEMLDGAAHLATIEQAETVNSVLGKHLG